MNYTTHEHDLEPFDHKTLPTLEGLHIYPYTTPKKAIKKWKSPLIGFLELTWKIKIWVSDEDNPPVKVDYWVKDGKLENSGIIPPDTFWADYRAARADRTDGEIADFLNSIEKRKEEEEGGGPGRYKHYGERDIKGLGPERLLEVLRKAEAHKS